MEASLECHQHPAFVHYTVTFTVSCTVYGVLFDTHRRPFPVHTLFSKDGSSFSWCGGGRRSPDSLSASIGPLLKVSKCTSIFLSLFPSPPQRLSSWQRRGGGLQALGCDCQHTIRKKKRASRWLFFFSRSRNGFPPFCTRPGAPHQSHVTDPSTE